MRIKKLDYCQIIGHNQIYTIHSIENDTVNIYPYGGGLNLKVSINKIVILEKLPNFILGNFWAEIDDDSVIYPCFANIHERWNGFAMPRFEPEILKIIMKEGDYRFITRSSCDKYDIYGWGQDYNENVSYEDQTYTAVYLDDHGLAMTDGWTWSIYNDKGCYVHSDGLDPDYDPVILEKINEAKIIYSGKYKLII